MNAEQPQQVDAWASAAAYEAYMGRWSRLVARDVVAWLGAPAASRWLDAGCGAGAVTEIILAEGAPDAVTGIDTSAPFLAYARDRIPDPRARFEVGDLQAIPAAAGAFDVVISGLVLNFVREPQRAAAEMARVLRRGGMAAAYVWDYAGEMQFMRRFWDAAAALDPAAAELDQGRRFPLCRPEPLAELMAGAGLHAVEVRAVDIPTTFRDFDDYWSPFLRGQGPAPSYTVSLDTDQRTRLRERLRTTLPTAADGSIPLTARAWVVRGVA
jgi:SAM-dependent methyltransferase